MVEEFGPNYVLLSWQPPESDGGSPVTGYLVERSDVTGWSWLPVNKEAISATELRIDHLHEGYPYEFRVSAVNTVGTGKPSPASEQITCRETIGN